MPRTRTFPQKQTHDCDITAWRNAIFVVFALTGIGLSTWVSRTPAVRDSLHASTADMGWIIFGLAAGSIVGLTGSAHIIARIGGRSTILVALLFAALGLAIVGVGSLVLLSPVIFVGLAVFGSGYGLCDVAMNVEGAAYERTRGRTIMPLFHAAFSVGTILGAGLGALAEFLQLAVFLHLCIAAAVVALTAALAVRHVPGQLSDVNLSDEPAMTTRQRWSVWMEPRTLLIGLIVLGLAFAEGSANDWLPLAMVDGHGVDRATGALVFGIFVTAMTVGRVAGSTLLDTYGRVRVLRLSAGAAVAGLLIVIFGPGASVATVGVVFWGLGASLGFPVGLSAAADDPRSAAARVSAVATLGYLAFLAGPPILGLLGQQIGLLHAFLVVLILVALSGIISPAARPIAGARTPRTLVRR